MVVQMGIDWARHELVARVRCGDKSKKVKLARNLSGVEELMRLARALGGSEAQVEVSIEAGDVGLVAALHAKGAVVYVQDAKQARRFAESLGSSGAKDDDRDAQTLLRMLDSAPHRGSVWEPSEELRETAGVLLDDHDDVSAKIQRAVNQLREHLVYSHPALERALPDLTSESALRVLQAVPTWQHGAALSQEEREQVLDSCRFRATRRAQVAAALSEQWVEQPQVVREAHAARVRRLVSELGLLRKQQAELDAGMDALAAQYTQTEQLRSLPGIGVMLALSLLALDAQSLSQGERDALGVWCGACPVARQSGKSLHVVRMRKSSPVRGRRTAYLLAMQAIRRLGWAKAQYAHLRGRGKAHGTALRIIARSLLRLLAALLRTGEPYDEARYLRALQSKGVAWAAGLGQTESVAGEMA